MKNEASLCRVKSCSTDDGYLIAWWQKVKYLSSLNSLNKQKISFTFSDLGSLTSFDNPGVFGSHTRFLFIFKQALRWIREAAMDC